MSVKKVVILDGCGASDDDLTPLLGILTDVLQADGAQIETYHLREMKLAHCIGCFGCWLKTPGICVEDDSGRRIARAVVQSDVTVFFTPVTFGGYSPDLKKMMDHFIQIISPYFQIEHGEVHHPRRYAHLPRLMMIGVERRENPHEAQIFRILAGRNAINFHPPSYAAEVVNATDAPAAIRERLQRVLGRSDPFPFGETAAASMPAADPGPVAGAAVPQRALLIIGSPRTNSPSASGVLGSYLLEALGNRGWQTESLTLRAGLGREGGEAALLESTRRAGLICLVFPLYADALPHLVTKALMVMANDRRLTPDPAPQRLLAVVNSGFPETHQNAVALAICREFAAQSGMAWSGGLALGGGGAIGGEPLNAAKRSGPPAGHVIRALDLTAAALSEGRPAPAEAATLLAKSPIPLLPAALWHRLYMRFAAKSFEQEAARNGIPREKLLDQPYAA